MQKNYIFQIQNAVYKTLFSANLGIEIILNRGLSVVYPHIIIVGTKKTVSENLQTICVTEIQVNTKEISLANTIDILSKIEDLLNLQNVRNKINFYSLHFCGVMSSEILTNEDGNFCGRVFLRSIMD
jgi:hypothetical protein